MHIDAVLFDLDGVLVDSAKANCEFYSEILTELGYDRPTDEDCAAVFHLTMVEALRVLSNEHSPSKLEHIWNEGRAHRFPIELVRIPYGAQDIVSILSSRYLLGIVTNGLREAVEDFYRMSGRRSQFSVSVAFEDVDRHKPHAEPLIHALDVLNVIPDRAIYVGDSPSDVMAARNAGTWAATIGPRTDMGADVNVRSFDSLLKALADAAELTKS